MKNLNDIGESAFAVQRSDYYSENKIKYNHEGFTVAYKDGLTPNQIKKLLKFALKSFLGDEYIVTEDELVDYFNNTYGCSVKSGQFDDKDGNIVNILDNNDKILEQYHSYADKDVLLRYIKCLDMIKKGYCISIGEDKHPSLQKEFWSALHDKDRFYKL